MEHTDTIQCTLPVSIVDALRARAEQEQVTVDDLLLDLARQSMTIPICELTILAQIWLGEEGEATHYVLARNGPRYVFAWGPGYVTRIWHQDVAEAASYADVGAIWSWSDDEARQDARACFEALDLSGSDRRAVERAFGIRLA